jgi:RNA polymerase sigma-70 factor, ECF subfamily
MTANRQKSQIEELKLLKRLLSGEVRAFQAFHKRYNRLIASCVRKVFHKHSVDYTEEDMGDTIGQAFLNMVKDDYRKLRLYDSEKGYKLSSWIGLISTNSAYDFLRKLKAKTVSLDDTEKYMPEPISNLPSPVENLEQKEQISLLLEAIKQLSNNEKRFVDLCYKHQLTHEEISQQMGLSLNTVYSKKNKIKTKLSNIISKIVQKNEKDG